MTTVLNRDSIKVKRDLQKRVENWVAQYCEALEENFNQYSIRSYKRSGCRTISTNARGCGFRCKKC